MRIPTCILAAVVAATASAFVAAAAEPPAPAGMLHEPREVHLADVRQLTFEGENAEAYWAPDGSHLIFQSARPPYGCDQIFLLWPDRPLSLELVSSGRGRTTCSYYTADGQRVIYASTHLSGDACPPVPDHSQGYVWPIYDTYELFTAKPDGSDLKRLTDNHAYDAEATVCPRDGSILFTSSRDGDLELYRMNADGSDVRRLTHTPGYDGGGFFSADCSKIVWRASRPREGAELDDFRRLLAQGLVRPGQLELYVANADGSDARQVTHLGAASFAPYFFPDGKRIIFSSNYGDPKGREFDIWAVDLDGGNLERITYAPGFDGFPMFSPDGRQLAFASNRNQGKPGETDIYLARWVEETKPAAAGGEKHAQQFRADVGWLADDRRGGRGIGGAGLAEAGEWIESRFRALGVEPALPAGAYRQELEVPADPGAARVVALHGAGAEPAAARERVFNVVGRIPAGGAAPLPGSLLVGAHYDHLGFGGLGSLAPGAVEPYNGADDNASGVAALLEVARRLQAGRSALRRDVVLAAFTAEEPGALGAAALLGAAPPSLATTGFVAMLNLDMVGRLRDGGLSLLREGPDLGWGGLTGPACAAAGLACRMLVGGREVTDGTPFAAAGVPVLRFWTGRHADYHRPSDDLDKIDAEGGVEVAGLAADLTLALARAELPLAAAGGDAS